MDEQNDFQYFNITKNERDSAIGFLLESLLHARHECRIPSNNKVFDEDVNIYLAHLLFANSLPDYNEMVSRYLSIYTSDLMGLIEQTDDKVVHYFIYKVNADYLLVHLGMFNDLSPINKGPFQKSEAQFIELAKEYYDNAAVCNRHIYRKRTAVSEVLTKLAHHFSDYQQILHRVRGDFFQVAQIIQTNNEKRRSDETIQALPPKQRLELKQNEFLDLYGEWLNSKSEELIPRLIELTDEIRRMDPNFKFNPAALQSGKHNIERRS